MKPCTTAHKKMIQRVLSHRSVFYSASDDGIENTDDIAGHILEDPSFICLMPHKNTFFLFRPLNHIMYEMHVAIIEGDTRKKGIKHAVDASRWIFKNTPCQKLVSHINVEHLRAIMFASMCGMETEGRLKEATLKGGQLHDVLVLGATKEKFINLHGEV